MNQPSVSVVILNFNTRNLLEKLVPFALKTDYPNFEVVVADNGSTDGSEEMIRAKFPEVKLIAFESNHGFAEGYNKALAQLDTDYWVLLNSDVEVDPKWVTPMVELLESNPKIGAAQPKIKDYNQREYFEYAGASGGWIDKYAYPFCRGRIFNHLEKDEAQYNDAVKTFWASGAALMIRPELFKTVGGLDGDFFAHMEEIDLCWRVQNAGYEIWVCPESTVYHMGGGTLDAQSARKTFLNFRNNLALITKNMVASEWIKVFLIRLVLDGVAGAKFLLDGKAGFTAAIVKAHWSFFLKLPHWWRKRKDVPKQQRLRALNGVYDRSIVASHFIEKVKTFDRLDIPQL